MWSPDSTVYTKSAADNHNEFTHSSLFMHCSKRYYYPFSLASDVQLWALEEIAVEILDQQAAAKTFSLERDRHWSVAPLTRFSQKLVTKL